MLRRLLLCLLVGAVFPSTGVRAASPVLEAEALGLVVKLPSEWSLTDIPGNNYRVGAGPTEGDFRVNLRVKGEVFEGDLDAYVRRVLPLLAKATPGFRQVALADFKTEDGLVLKKLIAETQLGQPTWQSYYVGPAANGNYFVLVGSAPIAKGREYQNVFDDIARTIVITHPEPKPEEAAPEGGEHDPGKTEQEKAAPNAQSLSPTHQPRNDTPGAAPG